MISNISTIQNKVAGICSQNGPATSCTFAGALEELGAAGKQLLAADAEEVVLVLIDRRQVVAEAAAVAAAHLLHLVMRLLLQLPLSAVLVAVVVTSHSHGALLHRDNRGDVPRLLLHPRPQRRRAS